MTFARQISVAIRGNHRAVLSISYERACSGLSLTTTKRQERIYSDKFRFNTEKTLNGMTAIREREWWRTMGLVLHVTKRPRKRVVLVTHRMIFITN